MENYSPQLMHLTPPQECSVDCYRSVWTRRTCINAELPPYDGVATGLVNVLGSIRWSIMETCSHPLLPRGISKVPLHFTPFLQNLELTVFCKEKVQLAVKLLHSEDAVTRHVPTTTFSAAVEICNAWFRVSSFALTNLVFPGFFSINRWKGT